MSANTKKRSASANRSTRKGNAKQPVLERTTLRTSRLLDFLSPKELTAQIGHPPPSWPLVLLKELVDNALDACEEARVAPKIAVRVDAKGICVQDNGPVIAPEVVKDILDFSTRTSSREAYVAPDRGAQGNALKTIIAMPYVLDGAVGQIEITSSGVRHAIDLSVDRIRQEPVLSHQQVEVGDTAGTRVFVRWPNDPSDAEEPPSDDGEFDEFDDVDDEEEMEEIDVGGPDSHGERVDVEASDPEWRKWLPSNPTSAHWYTEEHFERLVAGYVAFDQERGRDRTVREFVAEFDGLAGTAKQRRVLEATDLARQPLSAMVNGDGRDLDRRRLSTLLIAMKEQTKPVKPARLGPIGKDHIRGRFEQLGGEMKSFQYKKVQGVLDEVPWLVETAFVWCPDATRRRLITGVNWSPGISNPFRELGRWGQSMDTVLSQQRVDQDEPAVLLLHLIRPRVEYTDRGKSAVVIPD